MNTTARPVSPPHSHPGCAPAFEHAAQACGAQGARPADCVRAVAAALADCLGPPAHAAAATRHPPSMQTLHSGPSRPALGPAPDVWLFPGFQVPGERFFPQSASQAWHLEAAR